MENIQRERCKDDPLGVPIFQRHLSITQSFKVPAHSSHDNICDETFPYMSGIFDDTMDPSLSSDVPGATTDLPDLLHLKPLTKSQALVSSEFRSQTKLADSSWINALVPVDISMSAASPHNDTNDAASMNGPNIMEGTSDSSSCVPESAGQSEKNNIREGLKNGTFNVTQSFKESSGSDSTASLPCVRTESNITTFDNTQELKELSAGGLSSSVSPDNASLATGQEKPINSTVLIYAPSNTTIEQPNEKLDRYVDVGQLPFFVKNSTSEPSPANQQPVNRTFSIYNPTTDLKSAGPLSNLNSAGVKVMADTELQGQSDASAAVDDAPLSRPSPQPPVSTVSVTINPEGAVCSSRSLDDLDAERKGEECQGLPKTRTRISEQECQLNPDISHSSLFSLDDTLDMKSQSLVTSTPIVLGKDINFFKKDFASSTKPKTCSQPENNPAKCTSSVSTSVSTVVNKPPSKTVVRRKIPQLSCKSNVPKTQVPQRPPTSQPTSMEKSKTVSTMQASNQPETSTYALRNIKRPVQLKGKNLAPAKNSLTAGLVQTSAVSASASGCALTADSKPSNTMMQPKPSGLKPPVRGRVGLSGMRTRSSLLPAFSQKHASSDPLPFAKRKKADTQDQLTCAETATSSKASGGTQRPVIAPKPKKADCETCTAFKQKLSTFHQELERFLQEFQDCESWSPVQHKFEKCLEDLKKLQADHQRRGTKTGP